jgi:aminoglycoside phosphotransferase (APT) family kinase protein
MHGDYQFANVMFAHGEPARLAAIIDWEMTTIGDPLLDLGWALIGFGTRGIEDADLSYTDLTAMPPREELLAHYEQVSGRSTDDIGYYDVLARWKLGVVLEKSYAAFVHGEKVDPKVEAFGDIVLSLIRTAAAVARTMPDGAR